VAQRRERPLGDRKAQDRARILPLVGLILRLPPVAGVVRLDGAVFGVPLTLAYLFLVWALLIAAAALLSRRLRAELDAAPGAAEDER
jgi:hypothetical protein